MKTVFYTIVIPLLLIVGLPAYAQSNKGTEFYTAFLCHNNNTADNSGAEMVLYITSDLSTQGRVEVGGVLLQEFTVMANSVTVVDIPATAHMGTQELFTNKSIHITAERPVAIYAHIYAQNVSGATLLLPVNAMGKDYMSINYTQRSNARADNPAFSTFAVIGTEDNTSVSITPTADLVNSQPAGTPFTITLNKGDVYQGMSFGDLTGTRIKSVDNGTSACQKIVVFSGSSRIGIGCNPLSQSFSSDNLFQQLYPTSTWGKNYVAAPLLSRPFDVYRIILSDPNTVVKLNGATLGPSFFTNGLYFEFTSTETNIVSADKPIQLVQYSPTQGQTLDCTTTRGDLGDPEMIYLSPIEQGLNHVTLYSTSRFNIVNSFINVIIPTTAVSTVTLDGRPYSAFTEISGSQYSYAQMSVSPGSHTINAAVPFNAIAYGFGNTESYGYAAGTNLQDLNTNVGLKNPEDVNVPLTMGCSDQTYNLQTILPFLTPMMTWRIDGVMKRDITNPAVSRTFIRDGKTLYVYEYPDVVNFDAGTHTVTASVFNPLSSGDCGSNLDVENVFTITDPPGKDITVTASTCLGDPVLFKDNTTTATSNAIKSWQWDFGDGSPLSTEQAPSHIYAAPGDYNVRLTVVDYSGCVTVTDVKTVHIIPRPIAAFTFSSPDCVSQVINFTSTSQAIEPGATVTKWLWDFGDGTPPSAEQNPVHVFAATGNYNVSLTVTTSLGCVSEILVTPVTVHPLPVADFELPDACVMDRNSQFTSTSTIADGTESEFSYEWDFGDPGSGSSNKSALPNPQHSYTSEDDYTVTLKVTSKYGCVDIKQQIFTVNSADPNARFTVQSIYNCSADGLTFIDGSKPDFGRVTRLRFYYDVVNKPTEYVEFYRNTLRSDKTYHIDYPVNNTGSPIAYTVKLVAFTGTGTGCMAETPTQVIYMNPDPVVTLKIGDTGFTGQPAYCQNDAPVQFAGEPMHNLPGVHEFKGPGMSANGWFDPKAAGPGIHTITYKFIATGTNTACQYNTNFQILVNPNPVVVLPEKHLVLEGSQLTLKPTVNVLGGGNLTYKWTPATGLSADDILNPVVSINTDITYTLTVTTDNGCPTAVQTFVKVLKVPVIPNAFTPNGDGINDLWEVKYLNDYPNATVEVFNRAGARVFYTNGYTKPWDGTHSGSNLPTGTYYYIISPNNGRKPIAGYITLIK